MKWKLKLNNLNPDKFQTIQVDATSIYFIKYVMYFTSDKFHNFFSIKNNYL